MPNLWRRQPGNRIASKDLVRNGETDPAQKVAAGFFEEKESHQGDASVRGGGAIAAVVLAGMLGVAQVLGSGSAVASGQKNGMSGGSTQATITDDFNRPDEYALQPPWDTNWTNQGGDDVPSFALLSNGIQIVWASSEERNYAVFKVVDPSEDQEIFADVVFGGGSGFDRRMKIIGRASVDPYSYNVIALVLSIDSQRYDIVWERSGHADVIIATAWFLGEIINARWGLRFTRNQIQVLKNGTVIGTHTDGVSDRTSGHGGVGAIQKNYFDQIEGRFDNFEFSYGAESPSVYVSGGGSVLATGMRATPAILSGGGLCAVSGYKGAFCAVSVLAGGNVFADVRRSAFQEAVVSGGGVLYAESSSPRLGTAVLSGGGNLSVAPSKGAVCSFKETYLDDFNRSMEIPIQPPWKMPSDGINMAGLVADQWWCPTVGFAISINEATATTGRQTVRATITRTDQSADHWIIARGTMSGGSFSMVVWRFRLWSDSYALSWARRAGAGQPIVYTDIIPFTPWTSPAWGDVLEMECNGTLITLRKNGQVVNSANDTISGRSDGYGGLGAMAVASLVMFDDYWFITGSASAISGGGTASTFGIKGVRAAGWVFGGGTSVAYGYKRAEVPPSLSGGGSVFGTARRWTSAEAVVSGGGAVVASGREGVAKSVVLHGGGTADLFGRKGALAGAVASGGGTVNVTFVRTGGNAHDAYIPGGGRVTVYIRKEARAPPEIHGGGTIRATGVRIYSVVTLRAPEKKIPVTLVLVHLDFCTRTFGVAPCLATGIPCYNTWATCKYIPAFEKTDRIYRYSSADAPLPFDGHRPYVKSVKYLPTEIKTNLTVNARVTCEFVDEPDDDVDTDPYLLLRAAKPKSSYWKKLLARNPNYKGRYIEIFEGFLGDKEEEFVKKWVGKMENVSIQGNVVKIESADLLKDLSKIEVPPKLDVKLAIDVSAAQAEAMTVTDASGLDPSGYVRIADEIIGYTTLDSVTKQLKVLSRGVFGTAAADHKAKDKVQKVRYFAPANPWDILLEMLTVDAGISEEYIDRESFTYAKEWPGGDVVFRAVVSEPEKLDKLFFEIVDLLDAKAWVAEDLRITVKRNIQNEPGRLYYALTDDAHILHRSTSVDLNEKSRLSRMYVYWHKKALGKADDPFSYDRLDIAVDADAEGAYGDSVEKKLYCRWIDPVTVQEEVAQGYVKNLAMRQVRRNRTAQPIVTGALAIKDSSLRTGQYVRLSTDEVLRPDGSPVQAEIYQVVKREAREDRILLSLIRLSQRKVAFIAPAGTPDFGSASDVQKEYGFLTNPDGVMSDEAFGYHIW